MTSYTADDIISPKQSKRCQNIISHIFAIIPWDFCVYIMKRPFCKIGGLGVLQDDVIMKKITTIFVDPSIPLHHPEARTKFIFALQDKCNTLSIHLGREKCCMYLLIEIFTPLIMFLPLCRREMGLIYLIIFLVSRCYLNHCILYISMLVLVLPSLFLKQLFLSIFIQTKCIFFSCVRVFCPMLL